MDIRVIKKTAFIVGMSLLLFSCGENQPINLTGTWESVKIENSSYLPAYEKVISVFSANGEFENTVNLDDGQVLKVNGKYQVEPGLLLVSYSRSAI